MAPQSAQGLQLTDKLRADLLTVLQTAWTKPIACRGDYARSTAQVIAMAASEGLITSRLPKGYSSEWRVTAKGLNFLEKEVLE